LNTNDWTPTVVLLLPVIVKLPEFNPRNVLFDPKECKNLVDPLYITPLVELVTKGSIRQLFKDKLPFDWLKDK
jgi:hypothetical protein